MAMRVLLSWTGRSREPWMFHQGELMPGAHLQLLKDSPWAGTFDIHYLLSVPETREDARRIVAELRMVPEAPRTEVKVVRMFDPTDHDEIAAAIAQAWSEIREEHGSAAEQDLWALLNTGTPQMQTVWMLLAVQGVLPLRILQTSPRPLAEQSATPPVREVFPALERWSSLFDG